MSTGRFCASGAVRKCSSIAWKPASIWPNCSGPTATIVDRPMAESIEYRPPTQSQKPNMFAVSIPNSATSSAFVETATKCLAIAAGVAQLGQHPVAGRGARWSASRGCRTFSTKR